MNMIYCSVWEKKSRNVVKDHIFKIYSCRCNDYALLLSSLAARSSFSTL